MSAFAIIPHLIHTRSFTLTHSCNNAHSLIHATTQLMPLTHSCALTHSCNNSPCLRTHSFLQELDKKTLALGLSESMREGVLFSTYAMLASSGGSRKNTRLDQIVAWCGGATFDGCIIFDECHRAKNCVRLSFCWRTSPHTHVASYRALLHITAHTRRITSCVVAHALPCSCN
jgi:hypothetical protein